MPVDIFPLTSEERYKSLERFNEPSVPWCQSAAYAWIDILSHSNKGSISSLERQIGGANTMRELVEEISFAMKVFFAAVADLQKEMVIWSPPSAKAIKWNWKRNQKAIFSSIKRDRYVKNICEARTRSREIQEERNLLYRRCEARRR